MSRPRSFMFMSRLFIRCPFSAATPRDALAGGYPGCGAFPVVRLEPWQNKVSVSLLRFSEARFTSVASCF